MKLGKRALVDECLATGVFEPVLINFLEVCVELFKHH